MNMTVTIDKAGRVVIPKRVRDHMGLEPGDALALQSEGEHVTLRPIRKRSPMRKKRDVWAFHGGKPLSLDEANLLVKAARAPRVR